jgi:hypothetical protein
VQSADVVRVLTALNEADVDVWVDGGWGVDASSDGKAGGTRTLSFWSSSPMSSGQRKYWWSRGSVTSLGRRPQVCTATLPIAA